MINGSDYDFLRKLIAFHGKMNSLKKRYLTAGRISNLLC